jgi:putative MFS transporter
LSGTLELFDTRGRFAGTGVSCGLGRLSNAAGPLVVAAVHQGSGYQAVFCFVAGAWLVGATVLAVFGPRTRRALLAEPRQPAKPVPTA